VHAASTIDAIAASVIARQDLRNVPPIVWQPSQHEYRSECLTRDAPKK
jgi:hypothetical protein